MARKTLIALSAVALLSTVAAPRAAEPVLTGPAAFGDWTKDAPGTWRKITPADIPAPYATKSVRNNSTLAARPAGALPKVPAGFSVSVFAEGFKTPRVMTAAPNGDIFLAETGAGKIDVLRAAPGQPQAGAKETFAEGLNKPFGIAFYPPGPNPTYVYVGTPGQVLRFPYHNGDVKAQGKAEVIVDKIPDFHHITRDVIFSPDGKKLLLSVGSGTNIQENGPEAEVGRADILEYNPDGSDRQLYASGLRNPVKMALDPVTHQLWTSVNERDLLGDNVPPDYATHVQRGKFYGWPYFYIGNHPDTRPKGGSSPVPGNQVAVPDVLFQAHSAPLGIAFYTGKEFPAEYRNDLFVALHGSWNRETRTGYKIVRVKLQDGKATGAYEDFLTGFVTPDGKVWGRPVGLVVAPDGALLMSDDGSGTIWRVTYAGKAAQR